MTTILWSHTLHESIWPLHHTQSLGINTWKIDRDLTDAHLFKFKFSERSVSSASRPDMFSVMQQQKLNEMILVKSAASLSFQCSIVYLCFHGRLQDQGGSNAARVSKIVILFLHKYLEQLVRTGPKSVHTPHIDWIMQIRPEIWHKII